MADNTTRDAIVKYAGDYEKKMIGQFLNGLDCAKDVKVMNNVSRFGKLLPKTTVAKGNRPSSYNIDRRAGAQRNISGRKSYVYDAMKIIVFVPEEVKDTYLSEMVVPGVNVM